MTINRRIERIKKTGIIFPFYLPIYQFCFKRLALICKNYSICEGVSLQEREKDFFGLTLSKANRHYFTVSRVDPPD